MSTKKLRLEIPDDIEFHDLQLSRDPVTLEIEFNWEPIERICDVSGVEIEAFTQTHEDNVSSLIINWYFEHRQRGGAPDPVAEQLIVEVQAEDAGYSVQPSPRVQ